jgi:hypothetical protein
MAPCSFSRMSPDGPTELRPRDSSPTQVGAARLEGPPDPAVQRKQALVLVVAVANETPIVGVLMRVRPYGINPA